VKQKSDELLAMLKILGLNRQRSMFISKAAKNNWPLSLEIRVH